MVNLYAFLLRHSNALTLLLLFSASLVLAYIFGELAGEGVTIAYQRLTFTKPRRISMDMFPGAEAVFVSGTCYRRVPLNDTQLFPEPPMRDGDITCSLVPQLGAYRCNGTGYVYIYNYVCSEVINASHPVTDNYYHGVPGDQLYVAVYRSNMVDYASIAALAAYTPLLYEAYRRSRLASIAMAAVSAILAYTLAYTGAGELVILRETVLAKTIYLPTAIAAAMALAVLLHHLPRLRGRGGSRRS